MRIDRSFAFTELQQTMINSRVHPMYTKAGAGSGKTELLVQKEIGLLKEKVKMEEIFTVTFTNKAADEMRERLNDRLYYAWISAAREGNTEQAKWLRRLVELCGTFQVSTIHGFCEMLLREYGEMIGLPKDFRRDSFSTESREIIERIVNNADRAELVAGALQYELSGLVSDILNNCNNRGIVLTGEYLKKRKQNPGKEFILKLCIQAQEEIAQAKRAANLLTLNDLLSVTLRLLQNSFALTQITRRCKYLYIDEFQDTDAVQFEIVRTLLGAGVKVFLIGDDQQSIYAYRGADIKSSQKAHEIVNALQPREQRLDENFRSNPVIIDTVNRIFSREFTYAGARLRFPLLSLKTPETMSPKATSRDPYRVILDESPSKIIRSILKQDTIGVRPVSYGDIYILCRTNSQISAMERELRTEGFPVITVGGKGFYGKKEIVDIFKLFSAILKSNTVYRHELAFTDYYAALRNSENGSFNDFLAELNYVFREESIDGILEFIYEKSGIMAYYNQEGDYQAVANLNKLRNIAGDILSREYMQPLGFMEYLHRKIESRAEEDEAEIDNTDKKKGVITIMTIHKAKGLSLPVVIVPNIERNLAYQKHYPNFVIDPEKKRFAVNDILGLSKDPEYNKMLSSYIVSMLEEELRVLYVAMTRAEHLLVLTSSRDQTALAEMSAKKDYVSWYSWLS